MKILKLIPFFLVIPIALWAQTARQVSPRDAPAGAGPVWERQINDTIQGLPFLQAESVVVAGENGGVKS